MLFMPRLEGDKNYSLREERLRKEVEVERARAELERKKREALEARNAELQAKLKAKR
jgi:hypothetical protein